MQEPGDYLLNNIFIFLGEIVNRPRLVIVIQTCIFKKRNKPLFLLISHVRAQEVLIKDTGPGLSMKHTPLFCLHYTAEHTKQHLEAWVGTSVSQAHETLY